MPKVICSLPNASEFINGVRFVTHKLGMISEEVEQEVADFFARITGYSLADKKGRPVDPSAVDPPTGDPSAEPPAPSADAASAPGPADPAVPNESIPATAPGGATQA